MTEHTPFPDRPVKTIGIIGGSTEFATVEYYRIINQAINRALGGHYTGEVIIDSMNFAKSAYYVNNGLWEEGGAYLRGKAASLERAGAAFIVCVSNTWHRSAEYFMRGIGIPLLHIADPTGEAIKARGIATVALLGTKPVMSTPFLIRQFTDRFGLRVLVPTDDEQDYIHHLIFDEMAHGIFSDHAKAGVLAIIDRLRAAGAEGIILGCTEIPILIDQTERPDIPMFNTLRLHAEAAATAALQE